MDGWPALIISKITLNKLPRINHYRQYLIVTF